MPAPELSEPKWDILKLQTLQESSALLAAKPKAKTIKEAHAEVLGVLQKRGKDLDFLCGRCNSPIDELMERCWACGAVLDEPADEEPEFLPAELRRRAEEYGVSADGSREEVEARIEEAEQKKARRSRRGDVGGIEADALNKSLAGELPEGWRQKAARQYTGYWDPDGVRRIAVFHRGLSVHFSVADGDLDGQPNLEFLSPRERKRRHFGRDNYVYNGEVAKEVLGICKKVLEIYTPPPPKG